MMLGENHRFAPGQTAGGKRVAKAMLALGVIIADLNVNRACNLIADKLEELKVMLDQKGVDHNTGQQK